MPESSVHMSYVEMIFNYSKKIVPINNHSFILIDSPYSIKVPTAVVNGFRPDISYRIDDLMIIGEAKSDDDVERRHSLEQYNSYLKETELFDGISYVVFCVSWSMYSTIKNHLRVIKKKGQYKKAHIIVLNNKGDVSEL
jgi:hypothetical protein